MRSMDFSAVSHLPMVFDDRKFVEAMIGNETDQIIAMALEDYAAIWEQSSAAETRTHRKDNAGRFAANTFLREVIKPSLDQ